MTKRREASVIMFRTRSTLKHPVKIQLVATGTGTATDQGIITLACSSGTSTITAYVTASTGTNIGTLVGTST